LAVVITTVITTMEGEDSFGSNGFEEEGDEYFENQFLSAYYFQRAASFSRTQRCYYLLARSDLEWDIFHLLDLDLSTQSEELKTAVKHLCEVGEEELKEVCTWYSEDNAFLLNQENMGIDGFRECAESVGSKKKGAGPFSLFPYSLPIIIFFFVRRRLLRRLRRLFHRLNHLGLACCAILRRLCYKNLETDIIGENIQ